MQKKIHFFQEVQTIPQHFDIPVFQILDSPQWTHSVNHH